MGRGRAEGAALWERMVVVVVAARICCPRAPGRALPHPRPPAAPAAEPRPRRSNGPRCARLRAGFPVTSAPARHRFYVYSNWTYQVGVFLSRSSGMIYQVGLGQGQAAAGAGWLQGQVVAGAGGGVGALLEHFTRQPTSPAPCVSRFARWALPRLTLPASPSSSLETPALQASLHMLWAMPLMQVGWLAFFLADAVVHFWYDYLLLLPCFVTGGWGAVPVLCCAVLCCGTGSDVPPRCAAPWSPPGWHPACASLPCHASLPPPRPRPVPGPPQACWAARCT